METFWIKAAQLIVALGLLVFIHELGHYFFARVFGIKVNRFYLFFNPYFSILKYFPDKRKVELISWTKSKVDPETKKETEESHSLLSFKLGKPKSAFKKDGKPSWRATLYGIGWVPLGGYCDIDGMVDETKSADQLSAVPQPWEFRTKPAWQRLLVMLGGVLFNFILATVIYAGIAFYWGEKYIEYKDATAGMEFSPTALQHGFRNGDIPLKADGVELTAGDNDSRMSLLMAKEITVLRDGRDTTFTLPDNFPLSLQPDEFFMTYRQPIVINQLQPGDAAAAAGLHEGDSIVAVAGVTPLYYSGLADVLNANKNKEIDVTFYRDGQEMTLPVKLGDTAKLGIALKPITEIYKPTVVEYSLLESVPKGVSNGTDMLVNYVKQFKYIFSKEGAQSVGGFGAIGNMFPEHWSWYYFWNITAFLSVALAFMNFLPIPALDGGHILFLLVEMVTRRKLPEKFMNYAQMVGMAFLLLLLVYANGMDIFRTFFK